MQNGFLSALKRILADRRRRRMWQRLVSGMMAMVVFCTTYALILPGITLERQAYCGLEEHTHTDECYGRGDGENKVLVCTPESEAEFVIHTHDDMCYDENGNLICQLNELEEHEHSDDCYTTTTELTCDKEESEGHTHTDECYEITLGDLTCDNASAEHSHDDSCYEQIEELVCGQEETEGHTHTDECYSETNELVCDLPEVVEHKHSSGCNQNDVLACGMPEAVKHQHTEDCFDVQSEDDKILTCGVEEHTHTEDCYKKPDEGSSSGGGGAVANTETTTEGATEVTTATETTTEGTTEDNDDLVFPYSDDYVSGIVSLPWSEELPSDLDCEVIAITQDDEDYSNMLLSVNNEVADGSKDIDSVLIYKLEWKTGEDEYVLPEGLTPRIDFTMVDISNRITCIKGVVISDSDENSEENTEDYEEDLSDIRVDKFSLDTIETGVFDINNWNEKDSDIDSKYIPDSSEFIGTTDEAIEPIEETPEEIPEGYENGLTEDAVVVPFEADIVSSDDADSSISMELSETGVFAFALESEFEYGEGGYYKRIKDLSEISDDGIYFFVAQNGLLALKQTNPTPVKFPFYAESKNESGSYNVYYAYQNYYYSRPVEIQRVGTAFTDENNSPEYYRIVDPNDSDNPVTPDSSSYDGCFSYLDLVSENYSNIFSSRKIGVPKGTTLTSENSLGYYNPYYSSQSYFFYLVKSYTGNEWNIRGAVWDYERDSVTAETTGNAKYKYAYMFSNGSYICQYPQYAYETQFQIYQYVGESVDTKSDIKAVKKIEEETISSKDEEVEVLEKPDCAEILSVSGAKSIEDTLGVDRIFKGAEIKAKSDSATSNIESEFCLDTDKSDLSNLFVSQSANDGRLITDKSVIYGDDDYNAIENSDYGKGDFSVSLSALGQEWAIAEDTEEKTPLDVVFIYDISGSMKRTINDSSTTTKWEASAEAINVAVNEIQSANENNRVGIVAYSNYGIDVVPIGRYSSDDGSIFTYTEGDYTSLQTSATLYDGTDPNTRTVSNYRNVSLYRDGFWSATNTQWALQQAYDMYRNVDSTTVYYPNANKTITRQPIILLLTDGDPTFCTYNYMNPKKGPTYGKGLSYGIEGYYTILSGNYFKNLTSIHYNKRAYLYTVGMGIKSSGYGTYYEEGEFTPETKYFTEPDNSYMRAVLNPTEENVEALKSYSTYWGDICDKDLSDPYNDYYYWLDIYAKRICSTTSTVLYQLLTGKDLNGNAIDPGQVMGHTYYQYSFNYDYGIKTNTGSDLGTTENMVPGAENPYKDNYNYVDEAYFGRFDAEHLEAIFEKILEDVQLQSRYDFLLQEDTNIVMTDSIGDGMEVKGEPVLRYFGDNISATDRDTQTDGDVTYTDYYWKTTVNRKENSDAKSDEQSVDLSDVVARVSTNTSTGEQVVTLTIPEDVLPVFYPDSNRNFYFEELPLRLIYRVGLTETEEQALADSFDNNEYAEGTYYTNKYDGNTAGTTVTFYPDDGNPYYANLGDGKSVNKKENTTGTVATAFSEYYDKDKGVVTQYLGNNGKLEVSKDNTLTVDVEKCWISDTGEHPDSVDVYLYVTGTKVSSSGDSTDFTYYKDVATLNDANDWKKSWTRLRRKEVDGDYTYNYDVYYVVEAVPDGYAASYTDALGNELEKEEVPMVVSVPRGSADDESVQAMSTENMVQPMSLNGFVQKTIYINAVSANSGKVVITNRTSYKLPSSGGIGDTAMSLGAFASVILVVFLFLKRKRNTEI